MLRYGFDFKLWMELTPSEGGDRWPEFTDKVAGRPEHGDAALDSAHIVSDRGWKAARNGERARPRRRLDHDRGCARVGLWPGGRRFNEAV